MRKYSASNPKKHIKWQLNNTVELAKLKRSLFEKRDDTKVAYDKRISAPANMANLGLVYKIDDHERSLLNYKTEQQKKEVLNIDEKPKPFALEVPESLGKRTEPVMMKEWDYDYYGPLVTVHGTNYKAMSRDLKRNYRQRSEGELKRMCERYIEFKKFGEEKLQEYETLVKEQEEVAKQNTILVAPESIVQSDAPKVNDDNKTKRKRADDAADGKGEKGDKETTKEETTKQANKTPEPTSKQTPAKKAKKEVQPTTPTPKKDKPATTPATKETKLAKKETKPATKETKPAAKETKPATKVATKETKPAKKETKPTTKATPAPKQTKQTKQAETKAKKPVVEEDDESDKGMEFDFDENDLSSDDE